MARVQIGKKQRVEITEYKESTKAIAKETLNSIIEEGFNGADVLPDVWVLEKTLKNHIETSQPNIAPEITDDEVNDLSDSFLSSIKAKTDKSEQRQQSQENYETKLDFPKDLPQIKMGNVTVVQFPEGGSDKRMAMKVDGYKKVGKFYRKKISSELLGKRKGKTRKELDSIRKEQRDNLRRIKVRRGLLRPEPTKGITGGLTPLGRRTLTSRLNPNFKFGENMATPEQIRKANEQFIKRVKDGTKREKLSPVRPFPNAKEIKLKRREGRRRDKEFVKMLRKLNPDSRGRRAGGLPPGRLG